MALHRDPLNPLLYRRMCEYYGEENVDVVSAGQEMDWSLVWVRTHDGQRKLERRIRSGGEEYRTRCRLCRDWRARLHVNHRWGVHDPEVNSYHLHLINCFNEQCYSSYVEQRRLFDILYSGRRLGDKVHILPGRPGSDRTLHEVEPPGPTWPLHTLATRHPNHPALTYLRSRQLDPVRLGKLWGVSYCPESRFEQARNRIIVPIRMDGMLVMWQARYIGDDVNGVSFNKAGVAKYWTSPGAARGLVAYNLARALRHSTVVAVEGPADAWNQGPMCVAAVGKTFSVPIREQIAAGIKAHGDDGVLIIALDPKQSPKEKLKNRPHHLDKLTLQMQELLPGRVVPLWLPEEYDPGSLARSVFRSMARTAAAERGLTASFGPPTL
jgi:hypothetical protein